MGTLRSSRQHKSLRALLLVIPGVLETAIVVLIVDRENNFADRLSLRFDNFAVIWVVQL